MKSSFILLALGSTFLSSHVLAKELSSSPTILMSADNYNSHPDQSADLVGHVKVIKGTDILTCDKAHVNNSTGQVEAEGSVVFLSKKDYIRAKKFSYNFLSKTGVVYEGVIQTGQETIEGAEIIKTGEEQYLAHDASYTSCVNCPPGWKISGKTIDATVGGYAYVTQPVIRLYSVPVLWLPWIAIPIKSERQSGFLPPIFSASGSSGSAFGESYFWAINKSKDATLTAVYYNLRGLKESLEYRFVSDKKSSGIFQGNLIDDRLYPNTLSYNTMDQRYVPQSQYIRLSPSDLQRFSIRYKQHVELPDGYSSNLYINSVKDTTYLYDFPFEMPGAGDPALENKINITRNSENSHTSAEVDIYQNLLVVDPVGQNSTAIHRAPEIKYSLIPLPVFKIGYFGLDFDYDNFTNSGMTFYDPQGCTTFNNNPGGSQYRTGQRLFVTPSFSMPFSLGEYLDVLPKVEYSEFNYQFGYSPSPSASRRFLRTSLDLKTRLSTIINEADPSPTATKFKHEFMPEISYTVVPVFSQEQHPFFLGTSGQTFQPSYSSNQPITEYDNLQFDYRDRLADRNLLTFGITNKLIRKRVPPPTIVHVDPTDPDSPIAAPNPSATPAAPVEYKEIIRHTMTESYDISTATQSTLVPNANGVLVQPVTQPFSDFHSLLVVSLDHFSFNSDFDYFPYQHLANSSESVGLTDSRGDGVSIGYSEGYQIYPNYTNPTLPPLSFASFAQSVTGNLYFKSKYLDLGATAAFDMILNNISSYSLNGLLKPPGKCWGIAFNVSQIFGSVPTFGFTLPIFFGQGKSFSVGKPPGMN